MNKKADGMNGCLTKVKAGYYWWLPQCFVNEGKVLEKEYWSIIFVDDKSTDKVGLFVGPLDPPSLMIK